MTMETDKPALGVPGRVRTRQACQRCKMKKTKCDGSHPCEKCKGTDQICIFSSKKRLENRPRPRGYVQLLERQQKKMADGLRTMYTRLRDAELWEGVPATETNGGPSILDILGALDGVESTTDDELYLTTTDEKASPKPENADDSNTELRFNQLGQDDNMFSSQVQPQEWSLDADMSDFIDLGVAKVWDPFSNQPNDREMDLLGPLPSGRLRDDSVMRQYSLQMKEAQAQQVGLEGETAESLMALADLLKRCDSHR